jgi:tetratricopeptide (TPR) repeat protein
MTEVKTIKLKINKEYSEMLDSLPKQEYEALKQSIKHNGQEEEIVVNKEGEIIDGHHRYRCCLELGIEPKFGLENEFENSEHEKAFIVGWPKHESRKKRFKINSELTKKSNLICNVSIEMFKQNLYDDAIKECHKALKLDFTNPIAYLVLGRIYFAKKLFDKALDFFIQAREIAKDSNIVGLTVEHCALCHAGWDDPYLAEYHFSHALDLRPHDINLICEHASFVLANCDISKANKLEETIKVRSEAQDKDDENEDVYTQLSYALFVNASRHYLANTIDMLEKVLKLEPSNKKIRTYLAASQYTMNGQEEQAISELLEASRLTIYDSIDEAVKSSIEC